MENRLKERLTGAAILVALVVMLVPEMFHGQRGDVTASAGSSLDGPPVRSYTIDLSNSPTRAAPLQSTPVDAAAGDDKAPSAPPPVLSVLPGAPVAADSSHGVRVASAPTPAPTPAPVPAAAPAAAPAPAPVPTPAATLPPAAAATLKVAPTPKGAPTSKLAPAPKPAQTAASAPAPASATAATSTKAVAAPPVGDRAHPAPAVAHGASNGTWAVQLGLFAKHDNAERLVRSAQAKGFAVSISSADARGLYRVYASGMADRTAAEGLAQRLRDQGLPAAVIAAP